MNPVAILLRQTQLARERFGLVVTFEPGWETRGNGYAANWVGGIVHHTASPSSLANPFPTRGVLRDGRSNLAGPLCNTAGPADGSVHVVAAQAANHAGASGRNVGPLPKTTLFNPYVQGHEIDYAGVVPMLSGQYRAGVVWEWCLLVALAEAGQIPSFNVERIRAHAETSITGKWDPGYAPGLTIDMTAFRRDILAIQNGDDMSWDELIEMPGGKTYPARQVLAYADYYAGEAYLIAKRTEAKVDALTGTLSDGEANVVAAIRAQQGGGSGMTDEQLQSLKDSMPDAVVQGLVRLAGGGSETGGN